MRNVAMTVEDNILTIKVDLTKDFGDSTSGKSTVIASTKGNVGIQEDDAIRIGLNVYRKK